MPAMSFSYKTTNILKTCTPAMPFGYKTKTVLLTFSLEAAFNMTYLVLP